MTDLFQTISDAALVDALPLGSTLRDKYGDTWMVDSRTGAGAAILAAPETAAFESSVVMAKWGPLTLCYRPDYWSLLVRPSREDVARVIVNHSGHLGTHYKDVALAAADAVLALFASQPTVAEARAEEGQDGILEYIDPKNSAMMVDVRSIRRLLNQPEDPPTSSAQVFAEEQAWRLVAALRASVEAAKARRENLHG